MPSPFFVSLSSDKHESPSGALAFDSSTSRNSSAFCRHTHEFESHGAATTMVRALVDYKEPLELLRQAAHALWVERTLQKILDFRRDQVRYLLEN
jgi:hypothetical protein